MESTTLTQPTDSIADVPRKQRNIRDRPETPHPMPVSAVGTPAFNLPRRTVLDDVERQMIDRLRMPQVSQSASLYVLWLIKFQELHHLCIFFAAPFISEVSTAPILRLSINRSLRRLDEIRVLLERWEQCDTLTSIAGFRSLVEALFGILKDKLLPVRTVDHQLFLHLCPSRIRSGEVTA